MKNESRFGTLTAEQRQAFLDLLVLAMYVDGHLASVEDAGLRRILAEMGFNSVYDRNREFDAAVTRVRPYSESPDMARAHAKTLAQRFGSADQRQYVAAELQDFMECDTKLSPQETRLMAAVQEMFAAR